MDSPRKQSPEARGVGTSSMLRRDVRVYDNGQFVELLTAHPIRLMADGRTGVAYEGWVYPLLKGNAITLGEPAHEDASLRARRDARESKSSTESETSGCPPAIDRWTFESNGPVHYIKFDAADDARERLIAQLDASGLGAIRCVRSARRAKDGHTYAWSIRLGFSGPRQECEQRVRAILEHPVSELGSVPGARQRRRAGATVATDSQSSASSAGRRSGADEYLADGTGEVVGKLSFEVLPSDSGVYDLAATIRRTSSYAEQALDFRRLQVLIDVERRFPERRPRRYESGFPSDERDNRYVVLVIAAPGGGEDAIAVSPLKGQHATFLVRHGIARRPWKALLSMTKVEAIEFGAERLIFRSRPDEGLDPYEAMLMKLIELLDSDTRPNALIDKKLHTPHRGSSAAVGLIHERAPSPMNPCHGSLLPVARVAETPKQLKQLFQLKHRYWRSAAFASLLVQGVGGDDELVDNDLQPCVVPANSQVSNVGELADLVDLVCSEVEGRAHALAQYILSTPFVRLFDPAAEEPTPADIAVAAKHVVDFYEANLLLAQRVGETDAQRRYRKVIESTSHLVDRNLDGVDQFIPEYVDCVRALSSMERNFLGEDGSHIVLISLHQDDQLLKRIYRKLRLLGWIDGFWPR